MKEKMPKKSGRWWFWRKSSAKQVEAITYLVAQPYDSHMWRTLGVPVCIANEEHIAQKATTASSSLFCIIM